MPLSPGSVALLVHHWAQAPALARLGAAVRHEDANIRAAAARVMFVAGLRGMASPVMVALAKETSPEAGVEEFRRGRMVRTAVHVAAHLLQTTDAERVN